MLKMAFRNLSRNKTRTFLTITSIIIGIAGIVFGISYFIGIEKLFREETTKVTGEIRIAASDYELKSKLLDVSSNIEYDKIKEKIKKIEEIKSLNTKINFGAYAFNEKDEDEKIIAFGIEENDLVKDEIYEGRFLDFSKSDEIIVGKKVQKRLNLKLNDKITILSSTQYKSISAMSYKVVGFFDIGPNQNRGVYLSLKEVEYLLDMEGQASEILVYLNDIEKEEVVREKIKKLIGDKYLLQMWNEIGLNTIMETMATVKFIVVMVMGIISSVGIMVTMIMTVFERKKEIGILKAMGMKNKDIIGLFLLEGNLIGFFGSIFGLLLGGGGAYYISKHGIFLGEMMDSLSTDINIGQRIYTELTMGSLITGFMVGIIVSTFATLFPIVKEVKKTAVENISKG